MTEPAALEFNAVVKGGILPEDVRIALRTALQAMEGKRIVISIREWVKQRTLNQNSFFHGPFLDALHAMYREAGNDNSRDDIKQQMKQLFGLKKTIIAPGGMATEVLVSTRKYSTKQIEDFMETIRAWAAPYQVQLPYPNEGQHE